ncbi:hypothetical protein ZWY2020_048177 [Hordeum vulgare]|nr:hypothetical protein ZWY2020_048177 [Hordeum vulgare]
MDKSSALEYINQMFPTEASLSGVEPLMQKIQSEIRRVDASILAAVRQQSNSGTKAKEELAAATNAVQELMYKIREIKTKAEQSETMVQEICRDIKKLHPPKLTHNVHTSCPVSAVEQLQVMASKRQYKEAADSSLGTGKETEDENLLQQLSDACLVVDALEPSVREELVKNFCSKELISYKQIFTELAKLDKTERRYAWIKRRLRSNEDTWKIFPPSWHVDYLLCIQFCKITRTQLVDILNNLKEKPDVATLLLALQRTLEFEEELAEKFSGGTTTARNKELESDDENEVEHNKIVSDIWKKSREETGKKQKDLSVPGAGFNFHGIISSCFEPYMAVYTELEEKSLVEQLDKLIQEEKWETEEGSQTNILSSSMQVFLVIRRSLKRCSALTKNQTLFNLFQVFQRILKAYAAKLYARLPKGGTGIVAAATGTDGQIRSGELAESVAKMISSQFSDKVDMSDVQDEFSAVITKALMTLVHGVETKFDAEMVAMTRVPWSTLESVGDQSEYVNGISSILSSTVPALGSLLSPTYFQYFLDKLAASLGPRFYLNIYKCKHISETGAQQMLLDTQAVKTILLDIPALGKQTTVAASYSKFVTREMSKAEALLKVILSPVDSVASTYRALLPEGTPLEFQRILELKGLKKADQQAILEDFNKHSPSIKHPTITPTVAPPVATATASVDGSSPLPTQAVIATQACPPPWQAPWPTGRACCASDSA